MLKEVGFCMRHTEANKQRPGLVPEIKGFCIFNAILSRENEKILSRLNPNNRSRLQLGHMHI